MAERSRDWIWGAVALALLIGIILVLAPPPSRVALDRRLSTFRTTPDGAGALYETLRELGVSVDRRMTPFAGVAPIRGPLAVLDPTETPSPAEVDSLVAFVRDGGRLLVAEPFGILAGRLGFVPGYERPGGELRIADHPWTAATRPLVSVDSLGGPVAAVRVIRSDTLAGRAVRPLVSTGDGGIIVGLLGRGRGEILVVSDGDLLANAYLRADGLAPIVARAAAAWTAGGDTLWFDEYHHGHRGGSPYRALRSFLTRHGAGRMALQLALVALLALIPAAVRLGTPRNPAPASRRSRLEHVSALGEVYRQAHAEDVARRRLLAGFARRIGRERPTPGDEGAFLDRLERNVATGAEPVAAVGAAWRERRPVTELAATIDEAVDAVMSGRAIQRTPMRR